jgi:class 3 adenylate cyclase
VDSTVLASQLDPEELRDVVRAYQEACAKVIARFEGHIAQYLGDGLLVYFGYPLAHEDDAQRAVRAGLSIIEALRQLTTRLAQEGLRPAPTQSRQRGVHLAARLGIHTGLVVGGEVGGGTRQDQLALGETPNLAARLQGIAAPNTVVVSATTVPLLGGFFTSQSLGTSPLKGLAQPVEVYQVLHESMARSRLEAAGSTGLTPWSAGSKKWRCSASGGRRSRTAWGRWCCSAAKPGSANHAWCRSCRNRWPRSLRPG